MISSIISILPYSIYFLLILGNRTFATPYEAFPISKQYPPIARANQTFTFQISNDTYKSNVNKNIPITYQAFDLPNWLSFDSNTRTFSGVVTEESIKNLPKNSNLYFDIILQGTDQADMTSLNCTYQFVISNTTPIKLVDNFNLLAVLKNFGNTNGNNGLIVPPNEVFNITFNENIFQNPALIKQFYGRSEQYNSPLPNWLFFDSNNLEFSGTTPVINSEIAPEMYYNLVLIATEIEGYSGIEIPFSLVIGAHQLTTSIQNTILLNVTENGDFKYDLPLNYVYFDGSPINSTDLGSIDLVDAPSWVSLSNTADEKYLSGTFSPGTTDNTFSVAIYDKYGDVIYLNFEVESTTDVFAVESLPNLNAIRNEWFQYNFLPSQFTNYSDTKVSLVYLNSTQDHSWLNFRTNNLTLDGWVPSNFDSLSVGLIAKEGSLSQQLNFTIIGINGTSHNTTTKNNASSSSILHHSHRSGRTTMITSTKSSASTSFSTTVSLSSSTNGTLPLNIQNKASHNNHKRTVAIVCGVVIPVVVIGLLLTILFFFWRSRKQARKTTDPNEPLDDSGYGGKIKNKNVMVKDISGPVLNNPANKPNQTLTSLENPFEDDIDSLGDLPLSENSPLNMDQDIISTTTTSSSKSNYIDEKIGNSSRDNLAVSSREELLPESGKIITPLGESQAKTTSMVNPFQNRTSSFYLDSLPASRLSWRYNPDYTESENASNINRKSVTTLNTVSTTELLNTELKPNESIPKDPRKSTFALRDSVFWEDSNADNHNNNKMKKNDKKNMKRELLGPLTELSSAESTTTSSSSSSTDDFIPVKEGETYSWVHRNSPSRKPSQKRLMKVATESNVNIGKVQDVEGHVPEIV